MKSVTALLAGLAGAGAAGALAFGGCVRNTPIGIDSESPGRSPSVEASELLDEPVMRPHDLAGSPAMVFVASEREQQAAVVTRPGCLDDLGEAIPDPRIIEPPVVGRPWAPDAGWLDSATRSGIPETEARRRTVTMIANTPAVREALGLPSDDTGYGLLLDAAGQMLARYAEAYTEQKLGELLDAARVSGMLGSAEAADRL